MINCKWSSFSVSVVLITRSKWLCTLHCCLVWPGLKINGSTVQQQQQWLDGGVCKNVYA